MFETEAVIAGAASIRRVQREAEGRFNVPIVGRLESAPDNSRGTAARLVLPKTADKQRFNAVGNAIRAGQIEVISSYPTSADRQRRVAQSEAISHSCLCRRWVNVQGVTPCN